MNTYTAIHNADTLKMYNGIPTHSASNWSLPTIPMGQNFTGVPVTVMNQSGKKFLLIQISGFVKPQEPRYVWTGDVRLVNSVSTVRSASLYTPNAQKPDGSAWGGSAVFQVPLNVVGATSASSTKSGSTGNTPFVWTPFKKMVAGALAIGAVLGILKLAKVI